jgi:hypothetical protein
MIAGADDICRRRKWRLHAAGFEVTHGHFLVSWRGYVSWIEARAKLKNLLSLFLGRLAEAQGQEWFVDGGSRKRVATRKHFDYLIETYLPQHGDEKWFEGEAIPRIPSHILKPTDDSRERKPRIAKPGNPGLPPPASK